jgi:hypothetical protein
MRSGSLLPDDTPLCDILARTTAAWNVDFILESADPSRLPIQLRTPKLGRQAGGHHDEAEAEEEFQPEDGNPDLDSESGILTVRVKDGTKLYTYVVIQFCREII